MSDTFSASTRARRALLRANEESARREGDHVGTEHLLIGLLDDESAVAGSALKGINVDCRVLRDAVAGVLGPYRAQRTEGKLPQTQPVRHVVQDANAARQVRGHQFLDTGHILLALTTVEEGIAGRLLAEHGVAEDKLRIALDEIWNSTANIEQQEEEQLARRARSGRWTTMLVYALVAAALLAALYYFAQ